MKRYTPLLLAASLSLGALAPIVVAQPKESPAAIVKNQDDLYKSVIAKVQAKEYAEAVAEAEQALRTEGLSDRDRVRFLNAAANASSRQLKHMEAAAFYEKIVSDPDISNSNKISALKEIADAYIDTLAGQYLDRMDMTPAHDALNRALKLPNLTPEAQATALKNIGSLYNREGNYDKAISTYQQIIALDVGDRTKTAAQQMLADAYASNGQGDKAVAIYRKHDFDLIKLYIRLDQDDKAVETATKILDDATATDKDRWAAFRGLPYWGNSYDSVVVVRNIKEIKRMSEKYLPAFMKTDPNRALQLLGHIKREAYTPVFRNSYYNRNAANPEFIVWAAPLIFQAPKLSDKDYIFVKRKYTNALMVLGDLRQATPEIKGLTNDARVDAATHFWAQLVEAGLTGKTANFDKIIKQEKTLPDKEKAQQVLDAAQTILASDNNQVARSLYSTYEGLFVHLPTATINCSFVPNAPFDVGSWLTSPLLKDDKSAVKLDRPYGNNLKFLLETDSSTKRDISDEKGKDTGDTETNLHIVSDTQGIHIFFDARDNRVQEILDGFLRAGSFEMYIAPGKDQAYHTFLPRFPLANIDTGPGSFITMYPNTGFRLPSSQTGTLRSSAHATKDGFGLAIFLSWELFYDKLPSNGTKWQFESIRWTRSGGLSFAGSQSVHNRSSWGDIVFNGLTPQNLNAIKRAIVLSSVAKYRDAKKITGPVGQWDDPELGDPAFYEAKVAPLVANLDRYQTMVNKEMTAKDVETIFNEAVPGWMEIEFQVAAMRTQYLKAQFLAAR